METPLEHLTFEPRKTPELMDPSSVYTYDSYSGLEYMGFPDSPSTVGSLVVSFGFAPDPASVPVPDHGLFPLSKSPLRFSLPVWARCPWLPTTRPTLLVDPTSLPLLVPTLSQLLCIQPLSPTLVLAGCLRTACDPEGAVEVPLTRPPLPSPATSNTTPSLRPCLVCWGSHQEEGQF